MDTEIDDAVRDFDSTNKQVILESSSLDSEKYVEKLVEHLNGLGIETVFVYGVPYSAVADLALGLVGKVEKVWVVVDAIKNNEGNERELVKELSKTG